MSLIELRTADVTKILLRDAGAAGAEVISRTEATRLVGAAMFAADLVGRLNRRDRHLLD